LSKTFTVHGYSEEEMMAMEEPRLRAVLHERTHHTIEVLLYRILAGKSKPPADFGEVASSLLDIWKKRGFPMEDPDVRWCAEYVGLAEKVREGKRVKLDTKLPEPFTAEETAAVEKLIFGRRSIRQFKDRPVPDEMLRKVLYAGLMAPHGCNVCATRFIVLRTPEEWRLVRSDIPIEHGVMVVVCQDTSMYRTLKFDERAPQNLYFDAAAAADHVCLMAHALGLGACWLTHGEETQRRLREHFGLPESFLSRCHIILGWPDEAPIKSQRMRLEDVVVAGL
jgi:nitroreductase